jgi:hypothetical protein
VLDEKCDLSELCSQLRRKLDEYDIDKINVRYKLVFGSPGDAQAQASWVVLDKDLKHEEKLGRMCGTVIVGSQQNNRSSQSLVSCRVKVSIADSMIEMFVRGRCWSLTPTQGWIDNKLSCMELGVGQHMCVGQGRSYKFSYICSVLIVARLMVVKLHWPKENQPRPPPWPLFHTKQDGQGFSPAKPFAKGARALDSCGCRYVPTVAETQVCHRGLLLLCFQLQKSAQGTPRSNILAEIHAINLYSEVSSTSMMWFSSYSKLLQFSWLSSIGACLSVVLWSHLHLSAVGSSDDYGGVHIAAADKVLKLQHKLSPQGVFDSDGLQLLLSLSMAGCALIQQRVQQKRGGNCRCFLLDVTGQKFRVARSCTKCKVICWELMPLDGGFLNTNLEVQYHADCLSSTYSEQEFSQFPWDPGGSIASAWGQAESQGGGNVRDQL